MTETPEFTQIQNPFTSLASLSQAQRPASPVSKSHRSRSSGTLPSTSVDAGTSRRRLVCERAGRRRERERSTSVGNEPMGNLLVA
jgi:hypothetical protein